MSNRYPVLSSAAGHTFEEIVVADFVFDSGASPSGNTYNDMALLLAARHPGPCRITLLTNVPLSGSNSFDFTDCEIVGRSSTDPLGTAVMNFYDPAVIVKLPRRIENVVMVNHKTSGALYTMSPSDYPSITLGRFSQLYTDGAATSSWINAGNGGSLDVYCEFPASTWLAGITGYPFITNGGYLQIFNANVGTSGYLVDDGAPASIVLFNNPVTTDATNNNASKFANNNFGGTSDNLFTYPSIEQTASVSVSGTNNDYKLGDIYKWRFARTIFFDAVTSGATVTGFFRDTDLDLSYSQRFLVNRSSTTLTLKHQDAGSSAFNRLICPSATDYSLTGGSAALLVRDYTSNAWRVLPLGGTGGGGGVTGPGSGNTNGVPVWSSSAATALIDSGVVVTTGTSPTIKPADLVGAGTGYSLTAQGGTGGLTGAGGALNINGGTSLAAGNGGTVTIQGGTPGGTNTGGSVVVKGGPGGATSGAGGTLSLQGGAATTSGAGGALSITGGAGVGTTQAGGAITITGGSPTNGGTAGSVTIKGADAVSGGSSAVGGTTTIRTGDGFGASAAGALLVQPGTSGATGAGAVLQLFSGVGGSTSGAGGALQITAGASTSGAGGSIALTCGSTSSGSGGSITFTGGSGGSLSANNGGSFTFNAGAASSGAGQTGVGGSFTFTGGTGGTGSGNGGSFTATGGSANASATSGAGGDISFTAGSSRGSSGGGGASLRAGAGGATGSGGTALLLAGAGGSTSGAGGQVTITAGAASGSGTGGAIVVTAGAAAGSNQNGGSITIAGGVSTGSGTAGSVTVRGANNANGVGGTVNISAGTTATSGVGGAVNITATSAVGGNQNGGDITLTTGAPAGSGDHGAVVIAPAAGTAVLTTNSVDLYVGRRPGSGFGVGYGAIILSKVDSLGGSGTLSSGAFTMIDTSGGAIANIQLPAPASSGGHSLTLMKTTTDSNTFTLKSSSGNINGTLATTGVAFGASGRQGFHAACDGTNWWIMPHVPA